MTEHFLFEWISKPKLHSATLIEGLPGIGLVGKICAEYLINELKGKKFLEIYSPHFKEHAYVDWNGVSKLPSNELYLVKGHGWKRGDLVVLTGDCQPPVKDTFGHFLLSLNVTKTFKEMGGKLIVTLGGLQVSSIIMPPEIYLSATNRKLFSTFNFKDLNVEISDSGRVFGAAGLLLGFANIFDLNGFSLLGTTPGTFPDYYASYHVLKTLIAALNIEINLSRLEPEKERTKKFLSSIRKQWFMERERMEKKKKEGMDYVG